MALRRAQSHASTLVAAAGVVVPDVLSQDHTQVPFADEHPVGALSPVGAENSSAQVGVLSASFAESYELVVPVGSPAAA